MTVFCYNLKRQQPVSHGWFGAARASGMGKDSLLPSVFGEKAVGIV